MLAPLSREEGSRIADDGEQRENTLMFDLMRFLATGKEKGICKFPKSPAALRCLLLGRFVRVAEVQKPAPLVIATVRADPMRQHRLMAVATSAQVRCADGIMGATAITAAFANFSFW